MKKHFLIVLLASLSLVACKKDKDVIDNPGNGSSKVLKKITETKDGATTVHDLVYDASKHLTAIRSTDNSEVLSFTYGNDGNVTKIENKEGDSRSVFEFTYNNAGPVSGTFTNYEKNGAQEQVTGTYNLVYTVENSTVTKIKMIVPEDPETESPGYEVDYNLTYNNGNLTQVESDGAFAYKAVFTYGTKKPILPAILKYALDPAGLSMQFFAKNEVLTMTYDLPGTELDATVTNVYTYDSDGYVLTSDDGETKTTFQYE